MKKYIKPDIKEYNMLCEYILAGSVQGVDDTFSFDDEVSDGPVDSYLSREGSGFFESSDWE